MVQRALSTRSKSEPRLDIHNTNVNGNLAGAGLCGTTNLITGGVCHLSALHQGSCDFHRITTPAHTG
jgi:hypothetical protein